LCARIIDPPNWSGCLIIVTVISREKQLVLQAKVADAFRLSEEALIVIGGRILDRDPGAGHLVATIPWSMKSWGETITVAVGGADGNASVYVRSESRLATTLIDWGQSADNLKRFGDWVTKAQPA
jgi:hypothetical protein